MFGGLLVAFLGTLPLLAVMPWWNWLEARDWNMANATLTQTEENLVYEYEWAGKRYLQTGFSIDDGEENGGMSPVRYEFLQKHKPGDAVTAYVNPDDPGEAILDRSLRATRDSKDYWIIGAFSSVFVLPGLWASIWGLVKVIGYLGELARYRREAH